MLRNQWEQLIRALPATSPLFEHRRCSSRCYRRDGSRLRAATLKHVALTLATFANPDGTRAWPGINRLVLGTSRHRSTVIASLGHLETVGLIAAQARAGSMGRPREHATVYCLTSPDLDQLASMGPPNGQDAAIYDWFAHQQQQHG